jgi:hypothetical protein
MSRANEWATFGLDNPEPPRPRRSRFAHIDTSRMSWTDCHVGYLFVAAICLLVYPIFGFTLVLGVVTSLNGLYGMVFCQRPPVVVSRRIWWFALFVSLLYFSIFTMIEIGIHLEGGRLEAGDLLLFAIVTKLSLGQMLFLFRIRREPPTRAGT